MARVRVDILEEHRDDAALLYARLRRSCRLLDGNRAQTRALLARIDAHVDALRGFSHATGALLDVRHRDAPLRFVAVAARADDDALRGDVGAPLDDAGRLALRDALARYGDPSSAPLVDAWLSEGGDAQRCVGLELLALWRDPRAERVADRAVRRGTGAVRAAGLCALAALGVARPSGAYLDAMAEGPWRDDVLEAALRVDPRAAVEAARADVARGGGGLAAVLLGLSGERGDTLRLLDTLERGGPRGALPAALAMAGEHPLLDACWDDAASLPVSNALREAAYVVLGGEAPPVVVRDDMPEEPEDVAERDAGDRALRAEMADVAGAAWRWGARAGDDDERARTDALGPRHRRWAMASRALRGEAWEPWDDIAREASR